MLQTVGEPESTLTRRLEAARYAQPDELVREWRAHGFLADEAIGPRIAAALRQWADLEAVIDGDVRLTYADVARRAAGLATVLLAGGVRPGDVVSWQAPNWWEAYVTAVAVWQIGAVNNPILTIYKEHELRQIFDDLRPTAVLAPTAFRGHEHVDMLDATLAEVGHQPLLRIAIRSEAPGWRSFDEVLRARPTWEVHRDGGPDAPAAVAYTSGTTARAKGVVLGAGGLLAESHQMRNSWGFGWQDCVFMPAPLAHIAGLCVGLTVPLIAGASVALMDKWDAERALPLIESEGCSLSTGTPTFLEEIVSSYESKGMTGAALRQYSVGGAAVAPSLIDRADAVGIGAFRCYGMTEHSSVTIARRSLPIETRRDTDGPVAPGTEVSCIDEDGNVLPPGVPGEIRVRGPERMLCYVHPSDNAASLEEREGWFRTGDIGAVDDQGRLAIVGRIKDIINRGGEKFSAREMEDVISRHSAIRHVAVVPAPHERLGETPAAFVVAADPPPSAAELEQFVQSEGLARQKTPTVWRFVDELPTTPFGKVKKQELIRQLADIGG